MHENRETSVTPDAVTGRSGKAHGRTPDMHVAEESDSGVVPMNQPNKSGQPPAEVGEGRPGIKENTAQSNTHLAVFLCALWGESYFCAKKKPGSIASRLEASRQSRIPTATRTESTADSRSSPQSCRKDCSSDLPGTAQYRLPSDLRNWYGSKD